MATAPCQGEQRKCVDTAVLGLYPEILGVSMVVRIHSVASVAALAMAALPLAARGAEVAAPLTPNVNCTTSDTLAAVIPSTVSSINWGDGFSVGAPNVIVDGLPAVQFGCSASMFSVGVQGSMFEI